MELMKRIDCTVRALLRAIDAAIAVVKVAVALSAALVGFTVVAGVLAYLKREQWTKPYRRARDTLGLWNVTPWTSADAGVAEPEPVVEPMPTDETAS